MTVITTKIILIIMNPIKQYKDKSELVVTIIEATQSFLNNY